MNEEERDGDTEVVSLGDAPLQRAHLMDAVQPELFPSEKVLWLGQPDPQRVALRYLPLYSVLLGACATFCSGLFFLWKAVPEVSHSATLVFMLAADLIVFLMTVGVLLSPLWVYLSAEGRVYALTNLRILIVETRSALQPVTAFPQCAPSKIKYIERADESGDLTFVQIQKEGEWFPQNVNFVGIPQVAEVEALLRRTSNKPQ